MRTTYTFVELEDGAIVMSGIALTCKREERKPAPLSMSCKDGDPLEGGKVISAKGGYMCAVYRCACEREQKAKQEWFEGGISESAAQSVGWRFDNGKWVCPFCVGDAEKLFQVFGPG